MSVNIFYLYVFYVQTFIYPFLFEVCNIFFFLILYIDSVGPVHVKIVVQMMMQPCNKMYEEEAFEIINKIYSCIKSREIEKFIFLHWNKKCLYRKYSNIKCVCLCCYKTMKKNIFVYIYMTTQFDKWYNSTIYCVTLSYSHVKVSTLREDSGKFLME